MSSNTNQSATLPPESAPRLVSLDALRGFDMFWIVGGEEIVHALAKVSDAGVVRIVDEQMDHKPWEGFAFYDLIFPLFVFIVGVSLVFSLGKTIARDGRPAVVRRLLRRALLLYILGVISYGGFATPFAQIRLLGVLQRIALCYLFAGLAYCFMKTRGQVVLCGVLLIGYWALMTWVPVPGVGAGNYAEGKNLANYLDSQYLPLRKWDGDHDPEGLLSTLPAIATCLLGVFAGTLLKSPRTDRIKVFWLTCGGLVLVALGWLWNDEFPVIKKIWTSSYVLVAGGYSCLLLAAFYQVVDVWKFQTWAKPFIWIGMNAITIYMVFHLISFDKLAERLVGGELNSHFLGRFGPLAIAIVVVAMTLVLCRFLYQRKIFLRL
ncbi:MAG TPA: heparan-alpha-glucosaminide N-acetyltransferase domain-containing protein [Gemmataceae bacterium]|jgi:predicted acyltransferase|nr:heparan-alpha-glucosaminide N-acetyltransferase domain-containing protein [Gemmataceae bacterium]